MAQKPSLVVRINADTYQHLVDARKVSEYGRTESISSVIDRLIVTYKAPARATVVTTKPRAIVVTTKRIRRKKVTKKRRRR